jgi:adenosylmethionine-8-amino-7-oxononanoate aminotransferase
LSEQATETTTDASGRRYPTAQPWSWRNSTTTAPDLTGRWCQADRASASGRARLASEPSIELAHRLAGIIPSNLTRVFYSDAGATAVEIALKMAFQYWHLRGDGHRTQFASLTEAYHGDTIGSAASATRKLSSAVQTAAVRLSQAQPAARLSLAARSSAVAALAAAIAEARLLRSTAASWQP